jgi:uncharacterized protein YjbI with pentapeptide repeats
VVSLFRGRSDELVGLPRVRPERKQHAPLTHTNPEPQIVYICEPGHGRRIDVGRCASETTRSPAHRAAAGTPHRAGRSNSTSAPSRPNGCELTQNSCSVLMVSRSQSQVLRRCSLASSKASALLRPVPFGYDRHLFVIHIRVENSAGGGPTEIGDMDRDEALKLLKGGPEGIDEWNRKRVFGEEIPSLLEADFCTADLRAADLRAADLRAAQLFCADLRCAHLTDAILVAANLRSAKFGGANLVAANLRGADLGGADLTAANLRGADLRGADLSRAHLSGAYLAEANLRGANLGSSNLIDSKLRAADLSGADLTDANLRGAYLGGADLTATKLNHTILERTTLRYAACYWTSFAGIDLSETKGLDSVHHRGPSTIGIDTLLLSRGKIPEAFLRGCGMPEYLIENQKALIGSMEPIQFYSCFISYSTKDEDFAKRLHSNMRDEGLRVWFAPEDIQGGKKVHEQIDEAIRLYDKLLLVLSKESMSSEWVKTEIRKARKAELGEQRRKLFPIRLVEFDVIREWVCFDADSGKDLAVEIREYFIPDFSNWKDHDSFEAAWTRLLEDLKAEESVGPTAVS